MKRRLFWKLCAVFAVGAVALFWGISHLALQTEEAMSHIAPEHRQTLLEYGVRAESLYRSGDHRALGRWLESLQLREQTWAAIVATEITPLAGSTLSERFLSGFRLGRDVAWKIHLYFAENPIMEVPFSDGHTHFLIQLPQRMRPGANWYSSRLMLQLLLPLVILLAVCVVLYRHLMQPLRRLELATRQFSEGRYDVRVRTLLGARNDELANLAETFDHMAERTGELILSQRRRLAEMSHELRTPLARIEMAVDLAAGDGGNTALLDRIRGECAGMRRLVEDALTLTWLENESPCLRDENVDLTALLDSILDDARFEYPDRRLVATLPPEAVLPGTSHRALGQAIENVVRNALAHTPPGGKVEVMLQETGEGFVLTVSDEGPGVPAAMLKRIFQPFFRVPDHGGALPREGFGLGLALASRQLRATGCSIAARNRPEGGLAMVISLPRDCPAAAADPGVA